MGQSISAIKVNYGCYEVYKFTHKWTIPYFKNRAPNAAVGSCKTEQFHLQAGNKSYPFQLRLYSHGYNERTKKYLCIYLNKNSKDEMLIQFTCAVLDNKGEEVHVKSIKQRMSFESNLGWISYFRRDFLFDDENTILKDGTLTLNCTIEIFEDKAIMNAEVLEVEDPYAMKSLSKMLTDTNLGDVVEKNDETGEKVGESIVNKPLSKVSVDMNRLFLEGEFSDVSFKVEDQVFPVHKAVLSARSSVFKKMIKSQFFADAKVINISDIRAEIVKEMLHFIYSGDIGFIDVEKAKELYYASDKYELLDLKSVCYTILVHNLDVNNAIDILLIGYKHEDNDLMYTCIEFIANNVTQIQEGEKWMFLMKKYPELANKVFKFHLKKPDNK